MVDPTYDAPTNPEWWERAITGLCSHGGHGWDGDTCGDAPVTDLECPECGAPAGQECEITCIADQAPRPAGEAAEAAAGPSWLTMRRQDIDASEPLTLFDVPDVARNTLPVKPDRYGTPDLFGGAS